VGCRLRRNGCVETRHTTAFTSSRTPVLWARAAGIPNQASFASQAALLEKRDALVRTLAHMHCCIAFFTTPTHGTPMQPRGRWRCLIRIRRKAVRDGCFISRLSTFRRKPVAAARAASVHAGAQRDDEIATAYRSRASGGRYVAGARCAAAHRGRPARGAQVRPMSEPTATRSAPGSGHQYPFACTCAGPLGPANPGRLRSAAMSLAGR